MPVNRFEKEAAPRQPADNGLEPRYDAAARPEVHASSAEREEDHSDETIEEPGYGHGV